MNWIKRLNQALGYIDTHLTERLDPRTIAAEANTSSFHFQKMFHILADMTLSEYIRSRRLTLAAREIVDGAGILDTAMKYGYETQASFTRAFKRLHGVSPGMARDPGVVIKAYPQLSFQLAVRGEKAIEYEIRGIGEFTIAGRVREFSAIDGQNYKDIPLFWKEQDDSGEIGKMTQMADLKGLFKGSVIGACLGFSNEMEEFSYLLGFEPDEENDLEGYSLLTIPSLTWAVFKGRGCTAEDHQRTWKAIYGEWFPATDYIHDEGPEIEFTLSGSGGEQFEIWIPVKKTKRSE
jgi:AraC family transcriptional regulator